MEKYVVWEPRFRRWSTKAFETSRIVRGLEAGILSPDHPVMPLSQPGLVLRASQVSPPSAPDLSGLLKLAAAGAVAYLGYKVFQVLDADPEPLAIRDSAERHSRSGAAVFADTKGWSRPPSINGHIPDVLAIYDDLMVIEEFENDRSVFGSHARRQDEAFARFESEVEDVIYDQIVVNGGRGGRS